MAEDCVRCSDPDACYCSDYGDYLCSDCRELFKSFCGDLSCCICGISIDFVELEDDHINDNGKPVCDKCKEKHDNTDGDPECAYCGEEIDLEDHDENDVDDDGNLLCSSCKDIYDKCGGKPVCARCDNDIDHDEYDEEHVDEDGNPLCSSCYETCYGEDWICADCGERIDPDDYEGEQVDESGNRLCENCYRAQLEEQTDDLDFSEGSSLGTERPDDLDRDSHPDLIDWEDLKNRVTDFLNRPEVRELISKFKAARLLGVLCNASGIDPTNYDSVIDFCSDNLKNSTDIDSLAKKLDSLSKNTSYSKAPRNIRFTKLLDDPRVKTYVDKEMPWASREELFVQNPGLSSDVITTIHPKAEGLFAILKELAKEAGFTEDELSTITLNPDWTGAHLASNMAGVQEGSNIYYGPLAISSGELLAGVITHEFQHAIDNIWQNERSVPALRYRIALQYFTYDLRCSEGDRLCLDEQYIQYVSSYVECTANQAKRQLQKQTGKCNTGTDCLVKKNGEEFMRVLMETFNGYKGNNKESRLFIDVLAQMVPELALIPADFNWDKIQELAKEHVAEFLEKTDSWYFYKIKSQNGNTYVVPTARFIKELTEAVPGISLDSFYQKIWEYLSPDASVSSRPTYTEMIQMIYDSKNFHSFSSKRRKVSNKAKPCTALPMTADTFMFCYAYGVLLKIYNSITDEVKRSGFANSLDELMDYIDELEGNMELASELEDLCDELEDMGSDADIIQEELSELYDEHERLLEEFDSVYEGADERVEELAEEMREEFLSRVEEANSISEVKSAKDKIEEKFETRKKELEEEIDEELQEIRFDIEEIESEIESLMGDLEALSSEMENQADIIEDRAGELDEYGQIAEELEDVLDAIERLEESGNTPLSFECRVEVRVVDSDGKPIYGIPVTAIDPKSGKEFLLGFTGAGGYVDAAVDADQYYGWTVIANGKTLVYPSSTGAFYVSKEAVNQYFVVRVEDNEPYFVIESEFVLEHAEQASSGLSEQDSTLSVVIRGAKTNVGRIPLGIGNIQAETVSWKDYYAYWFSGKEIKKDGKITSNPVWQAMNAQNEDYYGAYLIPLSAYGELPRPNGEIIFTPLYQYKNGAPVIRLRDSSDFSKRTDSNPVPYISKAFDFGKVAPGRYELVVIMPIAEYGYHFSEITIGSGENKVVSAEMWNKSDDPTNRFIRENTKFRYKTVELNSDLYYLDGSGNGSITGKKYGTAFALAVDAKGKALWSEVDCSQSGKLKVPAYFGWRDSGMFSGSEGDRIEVCAGQIYLFFTRKPEDLTLYPVTYLCLYYESWDQFGKFCGRKYHGFMPGRIYCETSAKSGTSQNTYVAFWEQYHDDDGNTHYKTYNKPVSFELHWPIEQYFEDVFDDEIHLVDAVSEYESGRMVNYLSQKKMVKKGASYVFEYTQKYDDINPVTPYDKIPSSFAAEPVTIKDTLWDTEKVEPELTGIARMICYVEDKDGNKTKQFVNVKPTIHKDNKGIAIRFIIGSDGKVEKPRWDIDVPITSTEELYSINGRSNKIHKPSCGCCNLISKDNSIVARSVREKAPKSLKENLLLLGYTTCKRCKP